VKGTGLAKHYDQLDAQERFAVMLAAKARGDEPEIERLTRTCPRATYVMCDPAFVKRMETSEWLALAVMTDTLKMLGWLDFLAVLRPVLDAEQVDAEVTVLFCEKAERAAAARTKAVWEGFQDACRQVIGVEPEVLLGAHGIPLPERLSEYAELLEEVKRDAKLYREYRETVAAVWAKGTGAGA
jgi:hypothetical protein